MIQFDEHIFQMGWFNDLLVLIYLFVTLDRSWNFELDFDGLEVAKEFLDTEVTPGCEWRPWWRDRDCALEHFGKDKGKIAVPT